MKKPWRYSDFIHRFDELPDDIPIVLWCRVSGRQQDWNKNLADQEANLRSVLVNRRVLRSFRRRGSGQDLDELAVLIAYSKAHGAVIVAETLDRYVRHPLYTKRHQNLQATLEQMQELARMAGDVMLFTHLDPDATPKQVRSYQIERGHRIKGQKGGGDRSPGWTIRRRKDKKPIARKMLKQGKSYGQIGKALGVHRRTVWGWFND